MKMCKFKTNLKKPTFWLHTFFSNIHVLENIFVKAVSTFNTIPASVMGKNE